MNVQKLIIYPMTGASTNRIELSVIIPIRNEIELLPRFISHLQRQWSRPHQFILIDGGSTDGSWEWMQSHFKDESHQTELGRANQMNFGVQIAKKELLYFVHVDSQLPKYFDLHIAQAIATGARSGCFQLRFDNANSLLHLAAAGSRWNHPLCRGGDQSLFVFKNDFYQCGGYDTQYTVCEDINLIKKLYSLGGFKVLPQKIQTSSRRFYQNGVLRLLFHFGVIHLTHWLGAGPKFLKNYYLKYIR